METQNILFLMIRFRVSTQFTKNKIAFSIVKFLEDKKQIILTHNLDLVRLLEYQVNGCFNLYILNNIDGGRNGFIPVNSMEKKPQLP